MKERRKLNVSFYFLLVLSLLSCYNYHGENDMKRRVISAIIALIICIPLLIIGGYPFYVGVSILSVIGYYEIINIRERERKVPLLIKLIGLVTYLMIVLNNVVSSNIFYIDYKVLALTAFLLMLPIIFFDRKKYNVNDALYLIGTSIFLGITFNFLMIFRNIDINYLIYILLITIMTDTFAHFFGTKIGKHKLCPSVSPNKTIEGAVGGAIFGTFFGSVFYLTMFNGNTFVIILISLLLSIVAQCGDLVFSAIKREYDVKDFGKIMPGHGGVLDRFDSLLFSILLFSIIFSYL